MRVNIRIAGFVDAMGATKLTLVRYPTEVIYLHGQAHFDDDDIDDGIAQFHGEARFLPEWCARHRLTYYSGEQDFVLVANG